MISQNLKEACENAKHGEINLGTANGWGDKTNQLYKELSEYKIPDTGTSRNLGRCYNEYSFDVRIDEKVYVVVYTVDSSD